MPYDHAVPSSTAVELRPTHNSDVDDVAEFLHAELNHNVPARSWAAAMTPPWRCATPNHGFHLRADGHVVGAYLAIYSDRLIEGRIERFCNLAAWCVSDQFRAHSVRLLRALLAQKDYHFTDLSPSGSVIALNRRLKFTQLDTTTYLIPNLPWVPHRAGRVSARPRLSADPTVIEATLRGRDLEIYLDHRDAPASLHLVLIRGDEHCHVIFRRDRRKSVPVFASILYASNAALLGEGVRQVASHLLLRRHVLFTLAEARILAGRPTWSRRLGTSRPKMFRSDRLAADQIDYLYSELTCVAW
jgi:hypothetical protein